MTLFLACKVSTVRTHCPFAVRAAPFIFLWRGASFETTPRNRGSSKNQDSLTKTTMHIATIIKNSYWNNLVTNLTRSDMFCVLLSSALLAFASAQSHAGDVSNEQCFGFSARGQSIAGDNFLYLPIGNDPKTGPLKQAMQGQLINLTCASVVCPSPAVPSCFFDSSMCSSSEWCMLDTEIMWGPWAMGNNGQTPGANGRGGFQCETAIEAGMVWWYDTVCSQNVSWGPWDSMRGRCVPYRNEHESCQEEIQINHAMFGPEYAVRPNGKPFSRPLRCRPDLVCTGDVEPLPHTCVKKRPPNVCYSGPWWNSTWCKVGGGAGGEYETGLPLEALKDAATSLLLQLPQEHMVATEASFWYSVEGNRSREIIQNIVETLWPEVYRPQTTFPIPVPDPRSTGPPYTAAWNETAAHVGSLLAQTPRVWSTIHSLITNTKELMDPPQIQASQALALFLAQSFICPDCRGFWRIDVLDVIGLPPSSNDREDHIKWWWKAHNMVSEHTAATRGGHPWVYPSLTDAQFVEFVGKPANNTKLLRCQNPFFLPYADAVDMWKILDLS